MVSFRNSLVYLILVASDSADNTMSDPVCYMSMGDWINGLLLIVTALGLFFAGIQLKQTKDINRAALVKELYLMLYNNNHIRQIFYKIEWSEYKADESLKLTSEEKQEVDMLLSFFEVVCDMYYRKVLQQEDIRIFDYEMHRTYEHPGIQNYLTDISNYQHECNMGESYVSYKKYCKESMKLDD